MPSPPSFADFLRRAMGLRGMNQAALAAATKRRPNTVSDWCSGKTQPRAADLVDCAVALRVSADFLLGLSDNEGALKPGTWVLDQDLLDRARSDPRADVEPGFRVPSRPLVVSDEDKTRILAQIQKERRRR